MSFFLPEKKRIVEKCIASVLLMVFVCVGFVGVANAQMTLAQYESEVATEIAAGAIPGNLPNAPEFAAKAMETTDEKIIQPTIQVALLSALLNLGTFVIDRLAYDAAMAVATGGEGQTLLIWDKSAVDNWKEFGLDIAGEAIGSLSELTGSVLDIKFNLCTPTDPLVLLALQLSIKQAYQPEEPKCDFRDIQKNWSSFIASTVSKYATSEGITQTVLQTFAEGLRPGNNELSAAIGLNLQVHEQVLQAKWTNFFTQNSQDGFQDVRDFLTGTTKTPASTLQTQFNQAVVEADQKKTEVNMQAVIQNSHLISGLFMQAASVFTNTLLSQLLNKIYTGLFDIEPTEIDLSDYEGISVGSMENAEQSFSDIITTNPISVTQYNALSEFVVCPSGGVTNRNINNCVMDANFAAAIARGETSGGASLTVQEAIDEGLLRGDWPLIPSSDLARNQDPYCYTYGYCYGNLVKMRKARIIPVGWEMAAERNSTNPVTLQQIVDGFDECDANGNIDADTHKWCHLVDPNWVITYPDTQCRATAMGEILATSLSAGRSSSCVDTPSCIEENGEGQCIGGYGYCVREKNAWQFRGEDCPAQYATCLSFTENYSGEKVNYLLNTADFSVCDEQNAGCQWSRTNKYYNDGGTLTDTGDDSYDWLGPNETFETAARTAVMQYNGTSRSDHPITYISDSGATYSYNRYAYEDRMYVNHQVETCTQEDAGCGEFYEIENGLTLNVIQNPSFEDDEDDDNVPDSWSIEGSTSAITYSEDAGGAKYGEDYAWIGGTDLTLLVQQGITLSPNAFYTFNFYAKTEATTALMGAYLLLSDEEGDSIDLSGRSYAGDCITVAGLPGMLSINETIANTSDWTRYTCTFTTGNETAYATIKIIGGGPDASTGVLFDGIQLEYGEDTSEYVEGYNDNTLTSSYLIAPPEYLGCTGEETDPAECDQYSQVCAAQEAGCLLYTPEDGDPDVPAILSSGDECPQECAGYTTYKQESTLYDSEEFPLYFIADRSMACTEQYVGCESFTNLSAVATGGESTESYTYLRPCLTEDMADGTTTKESSTFFTWEGSDVEGYQLRTWQLLESNAIDASTLTFTNSGETEADVGQAPCTQWDVTSETTIACDDLTGSHLVDIANDDTCDQHQDIFENPDCREFFDNEGKVHYRLWSETISISDACIAYRLDNAQEQDCEDSGGYWTTAGACRYFGDAGESIQCPVSSVGCRAYTGGAGRNASTVFNDTFEDGDVAGYKITRVTASLSNESVATDGHSLKVAVPSGATTGYISTIQSYAVPATPDTLFDSTNTATCTAGSIVNATCEIDADGDGTKECFVEEADNSCGTLDDALVEGKTFVLSFWAKGNGDLSVELIERGGSGTAHDFVDDTDAVADAITLDSGWQLYELGPLDTTDFTNFDDSAILRWSSTAGVTFYLDNIQLKQVEENITLIKDSWVVPSTCDQTPGGIDSDQYYLGCEAYTDSEGTYVYAYQFSSLCSEDKVGCKAFYDTQSSDSEYTQVFNARCENHASGNPASPAIVVAITNCTVDTVTYCSIATGRSYCLFDWDGALPTSLPSDSTMSVVLGPEAVVVSNDIPRYLIENDTMLCSEAAVGCEELGLPTYSQDKTEVTAFTSVYFINDPESYGDILSDDAALFCEAWTSTDQESYYFKDPVDQTCTYETGVNINGTNYSGWFRSETEEPCYWTDTNNDSIFTLGTDTAYLIAGTQAGIWRNGDADYTGWVGECTSTYDLCSEFIDPIDVAAGLYEDGMSYYYIDDEQLDESTLQDSERCNGQVSQKEGCALFLNTTDSEISYNASASYIASAHADEFFADEADSLQNPIDCEVSGGDEVTATDGTTYHLCARRCFYSAESGDAIESPMAQHYDPFRPISTNLYFERSCYVDDDCIDLLTSNGETVSGSCVDVEEKYCEGGRTECPAVLPGAGGGEPVFGGDYYLVNDTNTILKVNRDRACAAWLSCSSSQVSWDETSSTYQTICNDVSLCSSYTAQGDTSFCDEYLSTNPDVLTPATYASRDTSWNGWDYSGYAIPQQMPIEYYGQYDIAPTKWCENTNGTLYIPTDHTGDPFYPCQETSDCLSTDVTVTCEQADDEYYLSYVAGTCDTDTVGMGGSCYVGSCTDDGSACAADDECDGSECIVGYCQLASTTDCTIDDDCDGIRVGLIDTPVCDPIQRVCVDTVGDDGASCVATPGCAAWTSGARCRLASGSYRGTCWNDACLTDIRDSSGDGIPDPFDPSGSQQKECRGYPESTSPYPASLEVGIVEMWKDSDGTSGTDPGGLDSQPYTLAYGFQSVDVCAPVYVNGVAQATDDCTCSYKKASYGEGAAIRYYPLNYNGGDTLPGICLSGENAGMYCDDDVTCGDATTPGICSKRSQFDTYYGWDGYCLEKDTSIQIFGSSEEENQACLTWFPVDQLVGSTDLYGKYTEAGYDDGETYYCAGVEGMYEIATGGEIVTPLDLCDFGMDCPTGSFAIMQNTCSSCGVDDEDVCSHYFCVPKFAHTSTGVECVPPNPSTYYDYGGVAMYSVTEDSFGELLSEYGTCTSLPLYYWEMEDMLGGELMIAFRYGGSNLFNFNVVPACTVVVQVDQEEGASLDKNKAWTNRDWLEATSSYVIQSGAGTYEDYLEYNVDALPTIYGRVYRTLDEFDVGEVVTALYCEETGRDESGVKLISMPTVGGSCDSGSLSDDEGRDARSYNYYNMPFISEYGYTRDETYEDPTSVSDAGLFVCDEGAEDDDCNLGITCDSNGFCVGGIRDGLPCSDNSECKLLRCLYLREGGVSGYSCGYQHYLDIPGAGTTSNLERLKQIFAESYNVYYYDQDIDVSTPLADMFTTTGLGDYVDFQTAESGRWESTAEGYIWDNSRDGATTYITETPSAPTVISVGECSGSECEEGEPDAFSINEQDNGTVTSIGGDLHVTVRFYTYADPDQMPIRKILVDWADDETGFGTYSGSTSDDNFYRNHRGVEDIQNPVSQCTSLGGSSEEAGVAYNWGLYSDACDNSYLSFAHDYVCSEGIAAGLNDCEADESGNITNSPCRNVDGNCLFRPRVFVQDNWGWCTGVCDGDYAGLDDTPGCYEDEDIMHGGINECDWGNCPGGTYCASPEIDPWVYFNGEVVVEP